MIVKERKDDSQREIARKFNVGKSTVFRINQKLNQFKLNQKLNCLNLINKNDLILLLKEKKRGSKNVGKISETKHFEFIEQCLNDSCDSYLSELCVLFEKEF